MMLISNLSPAPFPVLCVTPSCDCPTTPGRPVLLLSFWFLVAFPSGKFLLTNRKAFLGFRPSSLGRFGSLKASVPIRGSWAQYFYRCPAHRPHCPPTAAPLPQLPPTAPTATSQGPEPWAGTSSTSRPPSPLWDRRWLREAFPSGAGVPAGGRSAWRRT